MYISRSMVVFPILTKIENIFLVRIFVLALPPFLSIFNHLNVKMSRPSLLYPYNILDICTSP